MLKTSIKFSLLVAFLLAIQGAFVFGQDGPVAQALKPFLERGEVPGAVLIVATPEKILLFEAEGYADIATGKRLEKNSMFWIASMSKAVTAAAIMILVDEGKVSLDDPISKYFPEHKDLKVAEKNEQGEIRYRPATSIPTIRQLLSHTSGFEFLTPFMRKFGIDSLSGEQMAFTATMTPMPYDPGVKYLYSNIGIDLAGAVIEKVSGMRLEEYMKSRLFDPLEMNETTFFPTESQLERLAKSYTWDAENKKLKETNIVYLRPPYNNNTRRFEEGGGGLFSTAEDTLHFFQMLAQKGTFKEKRILSQESVAEMTKNQTGNLGAYGLGLTVSKDSFGHGGAHATDGKVLTDLNLVVIYMTQITGVPAHEQSKKAIHEAVQKYEALQ